MDHELTTTKVKNALASEPGSTLEELAAATGLSKGTVLVSLPRNVKRHRRGTVQVFSLK